MRRPPAPRFAYSPRPVTGELLSSWLQRTAVEHRVGALNLVDGAGPDVDWSPSVQFLDRLSKGSGLSISSLRAMTLQAVFPGAGRDWFAWSERPFPGCHAFCPACAAADLRAHGAVIQRSRDAGVWAIACPEHQCFLDGARAPYNVEPWKRGEPGRWARGVIAPALSPCKAPAFAVAFQDAAEAALRNSPPDGRWLIADPDVFLAFARQLADLIVQTTQITVGRTSGLDQLVGHVWPEVARYGGDFPAPGWLDRMPAAARTRTLVGVALLMMDSRSWPASTYEEWFAHAGYRDAQRSSRPWVRAVDAWGLVEIKAAAALVAKGPARFRREAAAAFDIRYAHMRSRGWAI